jgi:hypothetical protein
MKLSDWLSPDGFSAIGTVAAVLIALVFFYLDRRRSRTTLTLQYSGETPPCGFVSVQVGPDEIQQSEERFMVRLLVHNKGPATARTVEAVVAQLRKWEGGSWVPVPSLLPSNLRWTHTGPEQQHLPLIISGAPKLIDLGELRQNADSTLFLFMVTPQPRNVYNLLFPGRYDFTVTVAAENAPARGCRFELTLSQEWREAEMLTHTAIVTQHP